ncbi:MAG: hypothetical protein ABIO02_03140, partial [Patescibacteria group bacterium]
RSEPRNKPADTTPLPYLPFTPKANEIYSQFRPQIGKEFGRTDNHLALDATHHYFHTLARTAIDNESTSEELIDVLSMLQELQRYPYSKVSIRVKFGNRESSLTRPENYFYVSDDPYSQGPNVTINQLILALGKKINKTLAERMTT